MASVIDEREKTHGKYRTTACVSQMLKGILRNFIDQKKVPAFQVESLEMICVKIARILQGDCKFVDHWRDIAGYAELIVRELERKP